MGGSGCRRPIKHQPCLASSLVCGLCSGLGRQLIKIVQCVVVIRSEVTIRFPAKMVEHFEPLDVYGVEKVVIVAVNFVNERNLVAI